MAVLDKFRFLWRRKPESAARIFVPQNIPASIELFANDFTLHPLTLAQLDELWRLDQRCFNEGEAYSRETLEALLDSPKTLAYRAVTPSGAIAAFIIVVLEEDGTAHITTVGVAPEHRRRGLAFRLLQKAEDAFRRRGIGMMRLEVRTSNLGAQQLYIRAGYFVTQRLVRYYANGGDGLLMVKSLN
jgi:ribosomal protein S18 acetylase RimI-like enzyme